MNLTPNTKLVLFVAALVAPALVPLACSGSSSSDTPAAAGASGSSGTSAAGASGSKATGGGAGASGFNGAGTAGASVGGATAGGAAGTGAAGAAGVGGALVGVDGGVCGTTQCTDCLDNDGDGLVDGFDPDCTGYLDNDEGSFATGIPGDNIDPCKQDCFFDGNSGQGDDKCEWNLGCDPNNPGKDLGCPYDPKAKNCPTTQSATCLEKCRGSVPNGCDCFGCCQFQTPTGPKNVLLLPTCDSQSLGDATKCPPCTQSTDCGNPCDTCEYCLGKTTLPPECGTGAGGAAGAGGTTGTGGASGTGGSTAGQAGSAGAPQPLPLCAPGITPCTPTSPCGAGYYCLTGCCQMIIK